MTRNLPAATSTAQHILEEMSKFRIAEIDESFVVATIAELCHALAKQQHTCIDITRLLYVST